MLQAARFQDMVTVFGIATTEQNQGNSLLTKSGFRRREFCVLILELRLMEGRVSATGQVLPAARL